MLIARSVHPLPGEAERRERLLALIDGFSSRRVLVVGDLIADEFIYGEVSRVSREAPVLILKYDATEIVAGGAGNAANNVAALGGRADRSRAWLASIRRAAGCSPASIAASTASWSCARRSTGRRSRPGSSPAASTRRSSRWFASIAKPAGRFGGREPRLRGQADAEPRRVRRRAPVRLRVRPRHAGARGRDPRPPCQPDAPAAGSRPGRQPLSAARLPRT